MSAVEPPMRPCPACRATGRGRFCGECGADIDAPIEFRRQLLRPAVFANAHRESIWVPRVSSTLFPRLAGRARAPFRMALLLVGVAILVCVVAGFDGPLGVMSVIGWPLIFMIYVWQSDGFVDIPRRILATAMVLGGSFGVAYWLATGRLIAGSYGVSTGASLLLIGEVVDSGFLLTAGACALMLLPVVVTRAFRVPHREALDGFVVGAFGALWYSTAAAATILAPQFIEGLTERLDPVRLLDDSITYGIVNAVVTTVAGGLVGLSLWFQPAARPGRDRRRVRAALTVCTVLGVGCYMAVWAVDSFDPPGLADVSAKLVIAVLSLLVLRAGLQIALLHEAPDTLTGEPILCVHCERVAPDLPFCVGCGAASRASSASSRRLRRDNRPCLSPATERT